MFILVILHFEIFKTENLVDQPSAQININAEGGTLLYDGLGLNQA